MCWKISSQLIHLNAAAWVGSIKLCILLQYIPGWLAHICYNVLTQGEIVFNVYLVTQIYLMVLVWLSASSRLLMLFYDLILHCMMWSYFLNNYWHIMKIGYMKTQ